MAKTKGEGKLCLAQCELHLLHFQACVVKNTHVLSGMISHCKYSRMVSYHNGLILYKDTSSVFFCQLEELILSISKFLMCLSHYVPGC